MGFPSSEGVRSPLLPGFARSVGSVSTRPPPTPPHGRERGEGTVPIEPASTSLPRQRSPSLRLCYARASARLAVPFEAFRALNASTSPGSTRIALLTLTLREFPAHRARTRRP